MQKRAVTFYSESVRLAGDLYLPDDASGEQPRGGIVLCHGYTGLKDLYLPDNARMFVDAGYVAFIFDYKGWGMSEGEPRSRLNPHGRVADVQAAITYLGAQPEVDEDRIGIFGTSYGGSTVTWVAAIDPRVRCAVSVVGIGNGERWMSRVRRPHEWRELLEQSNADRVQRALTGVSALRPRNEILLPDPDSLRIATATRRNVPGAVTDLPLEYVDETLLFNPEWVVDRIAPRPVMFITTDNDLLVLPEESEELYRRAGEPKKLVVLHGYSHYEVYLEPAIHEVMAASLDWYRTWMPPLPA